VVDVCSAAHGGIGDGPEAIQLNLAGRGLTMRNGREVFGHACRYMAAGATSMLERNELSIESLRLLVPHQANQRIINHIAQDLGLAADQVASTIERFGNTGSASVLITLVEYLPKIKRNDLVLLSVFGGGYSSGTALLLAC
jgi:3-oxoacyl-[acyl-carrier-protein] synthase-3